MKLPTKKQSDRIEDMERFASLLDNAKTLTGYLGLAVELDHNDQLTQTAAAMVIRRCGRALSKYGFDNKGAAYRYGGRCR